MIMMYVVYIVCIILGVVLIGTLAFLRPIFSPHLLLRNFSIESCIKRAEYFLGFKIGDSYEVVWNNSRALPPQMNIALRCTDSDKWRDIVNFCQVQKEYDKTDKFTNGHTRSVLVKHQTHSSHITPNGDHITFTCDFMKYESSYQQGHAEEDSESIEICYKDSLIIYRKV